MKQGNSRVTVPGSGQKMWMCHLRRTWFSGECDGGVGLMVGLSELKGLFQPELFEYSRRSKLLFFLQPVIFVVIPLTYASKNPIRAGPILPFL